MGKRKFDRDVTAVLVDTRRMLMFARAAAADYFDGRDRKEQGLYTAISSARSVTFALQGLRGRVGGFDEWYAAALEPLSGEVGRWFVELRNDIEKKGTVGPSAASVTNINFNTRDIMAAKPPNAISFFGGDRMGRSGWIIRTADGRTDTVYVSLPRSIATVQVVLPDSPGGASMDELLPQYLGLLDQLVTAAEARYGDSGAQHT